MIFFKVVKAPGRMSNEEETDEETADSNDEMDIEDIHDLQDSPVEQLIPELDMGQTNNTSDDSWIHLNQ